MQGWAVEQLQRAVDFSHVLNLSITASWLILAVLLLRLLLRKAPRWITVALWGLVALRLLMPFSIESSFSLIPSSETVPEELLRYQGVQLQEPARLDVVDNPALYHNEVSIELEQSVDRVQWSMVKLTFPWLIGVGLMLLYAAVSYIRLRRQVRTAVRLRENIYQSENVPSPFVLGVIRPRIYLPFTMEEQSLPHVIAHEQARIRRRDHWWKPLGFLLLSIHWFNPLMWLAYWLLCRDIELACDEKVIKELGTEDRADYSEALLRCSAGQRRISACPLAFGESDVKKRVKSVLSYKKPAFWVIAAAVLASIVVAVCFLTNPESSGKNPNAYYLRIGTEGVMSVEVSVPHGSGGAVHADGSPFTVGEEVWLERLDGMDDLRGVSITALGENGEVLYALSIPEGASDEEIVNIVSGDGWLLAPSTSSESASIGIIGGADGPTAIFVTGGHHFGVTFERDGGITGINLPNLAFHPLPDDNPTYAHNLSAGNLADLPLIPYTFPNNGDVTISYTVYSSANAPENILMTDTAIGPDGSFLYVDESGAPIGQEAKFTREKILGGERFTCTLEPSQFNLAFSSAGPHETFRCFSLRYQVEGQWNEACFVLRTAEKYVNTGTDAAVEELEQFRTDYIGDASKVSAIAQRLPYPAGYAYGSIALQTDAPPYGLTVFLQGKGEISQASFAGCADTAFEYIGNLGMVTFCGEGGRVLAAFSRPALETGAEGQMVKTHICSADLDHDGKSERIFLEEVAAREVYQLSVEEENGSILWSEELSIPHMGWNTLLLYENGGKDYLIRYKPTMYQGEGNYTCTQFYINNGQEKVVNRWETDFRLPLEMTPEMERFEKEVNAILEGSILLATTEQLELVIGPAAATAVPQLYPVRFDPEEVIAAMNKTAEQTTTKIMLKKGVWPNNAYTQDIPAPAEGMVSGGSILPEQEVCSIEISGIILDGVMDYRQALKDNGFREIVSNTEEIAGQEDFSYNYLLSNDEKGLALSYVEGLLSVYISMQPA